jgi:hypothetical protein
MSSLRIAGFALAAALGSGLLVGQASAMPANGLALAATAMQAAGAVENVAYVCGPYRCGWRPGPYWGPRPFLGTALLGSAPLLGTASLLGASPLLGTWPLLAIPLLGLASPLVVVAPKWS